MDEYWVNKAHQYISEHASFSDVSDIEYSADTSSAVIQALAIVGLPASSLERGETPQGVRPREPITFIFREDFPLSAPLILLRDDFPRTFPHINPSEKRVIPCIYDGTLSELLQQSEWMNGVLNQLAEWLEKAASNALLDYSQGWEPMRNDRPSGVFSYDMHEVSKRLERAHWTELSTQYENINGMIIAGSMCASRKKKNCLALFGIRPDRLPASNYVPNSISNLSELYVYARTVGILDIKERCEQADVENREDDNLIVVLAVPRPCNVIGSDGDIEFLNFMIHKSKRKKGKKRVVPDSDVTMLSHIAPNTPELLKRLSGSKHSLLDVKPIALVGCGSVGSKVGLHLSRNGVGPFLCIDNDIFLPHNNARHALSLPLTQYKSELLSHAMRSVAQIDAMAINESALKVDYSGTRIIIDTSADLSVRAFLMGAGKLPPIVSMGLYDSGRCGILFLENIQQDVRLTDLWAHVYRMALVNGELRRALFDQQKQRVAIGQSCSSFTLVVSDAKISLFAAVFSMRIQKAIEEGMPQNGEVHFAVADESGSLTIEKSDVHSYANIRSLTEKNWQVRLSSRVEEKMAQQSNEERPNETGGVLLGTVFLNAKTIVVTDILPPTPDSEATPTLFILGVEGLEAEIKSIERKTCGKVTYLGTWHSHPGGGGASDTDKKTAARLLFVRNYEPTVCLIWTPEGVFEV